MTAGETVYEGATKSGSPYSIRYIQSGDAPALCGYINSLSDEHTFIRFQGEHMTMEDEENYVAKQVKRIREHELVDLVAVHNTAIIGKCEIGKLDKIERHIGSLGITVAKPYRREGVGSKLLEIAISEASKNIDGLRIITLGVFASNGVARRLYTRFGFREYGTIPQGIFQDGNFVDHVFMYKNV